VSTPTCPPCPRSCATKSALDEGGLRAAVDELPQQGLERLSYPKSRTSTGAPSRATGRKPMCRSSLSWREHLNLRPFVPETAVAASQPVRTVHK
jgi:hypothetical protein